MDTGIQKSASLANLAMYDEEGVREYVDGAPHLKHASLRKLFADLIGDVYDRALLSSSKPKVLDLGAGEGTVTLPLLELGAEVVAIDISQPQLDILKGKCSEFSGNLTTRCEDISESLLSNDELFDVIVVNSFLHHIPDYLDLIQKITFKLKPGGQFFSFQDPTRYDTTGFLTMRFTKISYYSWRIFKGDVIGGFFRLLRRSRGIYLEDSVYDNAEYHVTRNGVDQDAIRDFLVSNGFDCDVVKYFSTQSSFFQRVGERLSINNTFAIRAVKVTS